MGRKSIAVWVLAAILALAQPAYVYAEQDNVIDKTSDWFATLGKKDDEKSTLLYKRRTAREAKRAGKDLRKQTKKAEKELNAIGKDLDKSFGR